MELLSEEIEAVKMALPKVGYTLIFNEFRQNFKQFLHYEIQRHILGLIFFKGTSMEETGKVLNVLRQIHTVDNSEEDICEQEQVS